MAYKFFTKSEDAWRSMTDAVKTTQKSIYLESFILIEDDLTKDFFSAIEERVRSGVKVKIIVDRVGNFGGNFFTKNGKDHDGMEVLFFSRILNRNHRKVLIIDENKVFIGGVNISGKYAKWLDLHVMISGKFLIRKILSSFAKVYGLAGGNDASIKKYLESKSEIRRKKMYNAKVFLIEHWPFRRRSLLKEYYTDKIGKAGKSIVIVTPYFLPHRWLITLLRSAIVRGVLVEVILPIRTDFALANVANWIFTEELRDGIKFFFLNEMNHAKVLLIDDEEGMIGSNNIDALSFDNNLEAGIIFKNKNMIGGLKKILADWKKSSVPYEQIMIPRPRYYFFVKFCIDLLQPFM